VCVASAIFEQPPRGGNQQWRVLARLRWHAKTQDCTYSLDDASRLATMCPTAEVERDQIYAKDGNTYTAAGETAGIDLALVMLEEDLVERRPYGPPNISSSTCKQASSRHLPIVQNTCCRTIAYPVNQQHLLNNLHLNHTITSVAAYAHLSPHNLSSFQQDKWVEFDDVFKQSTH